MNDITALAQSHELLIANGNETANLLRHLANNEIDSDYFAVVSECESYGQETEAELSITEFALRAAGYVDALVEALEAAQQNNDGVAGMAEHYETTISMLKGRIAILESEVKFPGVMRCNTCNFSRSHVVVTPGGMVAGESKPEKCPNGCGPLWHDTYRRQYNELYDAYKELESRTVTVKLPDEVLKLAQAPQHLSKHDQLCWMSGANWMRMEAVKLNPAAGVQVIEGEGQ